MNKIIVLLYLANPILLGCSYLEETKNLQQKCVTACKPYAVATFAEKKCHCDLNRQIREIGD